MKSEEGKVGLNIRPWVICKGVG